MCGQTVFLGDEEGTIQDVWGGRSNGGCDSLTILDKVLTVREAAGGEERAGRPHSHSGVLLKRLGWGTRNSMLVNFTRCSGGNKSAAWSVWTSPAAILWKAKLQNVLTMLFLLYCNFQKSWIHTSYLCPTEELGLLMLSLSRNKCFVCGVFVFCQPGTLIWVCLYMLSGWVLLIDRFSFNPLTHWGGGLLPPPPPPLWKACGSEGS